MSETVFFFALVTDAEGKIPAFLPVSIDKRFSLRDALDKLKEKYGENYQVLKEIANAECYYALKEPLKFDSENPPDVRQIIPSLHDATQYRALEQISLVGQIAGSFDHLSIHLVIINALDQTGNAVETLQKEHPELYNCLRITVVNPPTSWVVEDVYNNGGRFVGEHNSHGVGKPQELVELEEKLAQKRSFNIPDDNPDLTDARRCSSQFETMYYPVDRSQVDATNVDQAQVDVKTSHEFFAFYTLLHEYLPDIERYKVATTNLFKGSAFKAHFLLPPFFKKRHKNDSITYTEERSLPFPLFVSNQSSPLPRRYTPKSDFSVWLKNLEFPLLIGEVISNPDERDRYRMLVQGIALTRLAQQIRLPNSKKRAFIVAIYMTAELMAELYIMMPQDQPSPEICISQTDYDLTNEDAAINFLRAMYNLIPQFEHLYKDLDQKQRDQLKHIKDTSLVMKSMNSEGAWGTKTASQKMKSRMKSITEEPTVQNEDDLGVFADEAVAKALEEIACKVDYVTPEHPNIAMICHRTTATMVGCLKFVEDGEREIEILQYLAGLHSESNHSVQLLGVWPFNGGSIVAMPGGGHYITDLHDCDTYLWPLAKQLFEAVAFMHSHNIAHMDLKPQNLLIPPGYGRLTVIDFGLSVHLSDEGQLLEGYVGTKGYIAPEVGHGKFSPIRADLWSVGKVVEELCSLCRPSHSQTWLLSASKQLLHFNPGKRPMMSDVLQQMGYFETVPTLDNNTIRQMHHILHALTSLPPSRQPPTLLVLAHKSDLFKPSSAPSTNTNTTTNTTTTPNTLAINRVKTILEHELEKRRVSQTGGVNVEGLGEEGAERSMMEMGGLECGEKEGSVFKFDQWEGGEVVFLGMSVVNAAAAGGAVDEKSGAENNSLESLWDVLADCM